jgi:hypothetical protein
MPQTEDKLYTCVTDLRKSGNVVSTEILLLEASKITRKFNIPVTEFKASFGWVTVLELLAAFDL